MRVTPLIASEFTSDGGSMFGLVPKPIWSTRIPADSQNRIAQHAHVLLLEWPDGKKALIDTGCGSSTRFEEKERALSGLGSGWPLMEALSARGVTPEQISLVLFTHLHWDHAGGALAPRTATQPLTFPAARHVVHRMEWEDAASGNPLLYKSYPPAIPEALGGAELDLIDGEDVEIAPGLRMIRSSGHTRGHSTFAMHDVVLQKKDGSVHAPWCLFAGDVCPTRHQLRMVFQTSYDTFPLDTRSWKRTWLPRIAAEDAWLLFDHDPDVFGARIAADARQEFVAVETLDCR